MQYLGAILGGLYLLIVLYCHAGFLLGALWSVLGWLMWPALILLGLAAVGWAIMAAINWQAGRRWRRRYAAALKRTPGADRLAANAVATAAEAPAPQAAVPKPAPPPAAPTPPRLRSAEDLKRFDE